MANVTYLLGAGASANALPIMDEMVGRLSSFSAMIQSFLNTEGESEEYSTYLTPATKLVQSIQVLINETRTSHQTLDTLAFKLFKQSNRHKDLVELKRVMIVYLLWEQLPLDTGLRTGTTKQSPDRRYDSFITALMEADVDNLSLKSNVKILTWNYDVQFELTYQRFCDRKKLHECYHPLQVCPGKWMLTNPASTIDMDKFSLLHLNGVAGYDTLVLDGSKIRTIVESILTDRASPIMAELIKLYDMLSRPSEYGDKALEALLFFNYSWELQSKNHQFASPLGHRIKEAALTIAESTEILVIVGYSFPQFNAWFDRELFDKMTNLKKVYIQDRYPQSIQTRLEENFTLFQGPYRKQNSQKSFILREISPQFPIPVEI